MILSEIETHLKTGWANVPKDWINAMATSEEYSQAIYESMVAAQDTMHLAAIRTTISEIDKKRKRKFELQAAVNEYNELEEQIVELRKQAEKLATAMTFRSPYAGYPEYVDTVPDTSAYEAQAEQLKTLMKIKKFPSYKDIEKYLEAAKPKSEATQQMILSQAKKYVDNNLEKRN